MAGGRRCGVDRGRFGALVVGANGFMRKPLDLNEMHDHPISHRTPEIIISIIDLTTS